MGILSIMGHILALLATKQQKPLRVQMDELTLPPWQRQEKKLES